MSDDRPRLEEIGGIAAEQATATLADLLGRTVHTETVRERGVASRDLALEFGSPGERVAGVFVDLAGALEGVAGLLFPASELRDLVRRLFGEGPSELADARTRSAVGELGNIALCAAAGAIAKRVGGVVVPSIPRVGLGPAERLLEQVVDSGLRPLPAYLADAELPVEGGSLAVRFVWIPLD